MTKLDETAIKALRAQLLAGTVMDTLDRALTRAQTVFDLFYDDEDGEPDQAIRDALTDLMHMAEKRGVDFVDAVDQAMQMWIMEQNDWKVTA